MVLGPGGCVMRLPWWDISGWFRGGCVDVELST